MTNGAYPCYRWILGQKEPNDRVFPDSSQVSPSVSHGFIYALETCLVNLKLPSNVFICLDVL